MEKLNTDAIMNDVIPDVILWKESGLWMCFRGEREFEEWKPFVEQNIYEPFNDFIHRVIKVFTDEEDQGIGLAEGIFPCVQTDYAIALCNQNSTT